MEDTIRDIQQKLQQNRFPNEASISQGIVLRLVRELGWNVYDIEVVWPEYTIGNQRADFALCHPPRKPLVLIEVKQPGTMSAMAEEQLATYAFGQGVPLVVLTSGADWHFYAPYGPGLFKDRRIHRLDLTERTAEDAAERFRRYLSFDAWVKGTASVSVQSDLQEMLGKQETRRRLPEAWEALVDEPHPQLVDLLASELERLTGSEPPRSEVVAFISSRASTKSQTVKPINTSNAEVKLNTKGVNPIPQPEIRDAAGSEVKLWINGNEVPVKTHRGRFVKVLEYLYERDPSILQRLHDLALPGKRKTVAQSPEALYPKDPGFAIRQKTAWLELSFAPGWYVDVNKSGANFVSSVETACKLAGVAFGSEVKLG